ncbi:MAG TPA: peptide chain release factor N(5)-glutamine methyltransferase [Vicinamibacterales bacterium]|nr:peptide chain release factor N(5)-glutamine methyltransferase [Vicinamibacterales bacterium]
MTYQECAASAARRLERAGFEPDAARLDVTVIARSILDWDQARWLTDLTRNAPATFVEALDAATERRARREPVAYIVGRREFFGRDFIVTPAVLIPRPDTEMVVTAALECLEDLPADALVVDVGTGSGCLAVSLAAERPAVRVVAIDVSRAALDVARSNAERLGTADRVEFRQASAAQDLGLQPHLIVSNPPYVREAERATLPPDVVDFEPSTALFAGSDGLDVIRDLVAMADRTLAPGGCLVFEIGWDQAEQARRLVDRAQGLALSAIKTDIESRPRVCVAGRR